MSKHLLFFLKKRNLLVLKVYDLLKEKNTISIILPTSVCMKIEIRRNNYKRDEKFQIC